MRTAENKVRSGQVRGVGWGQVRSGQVRSGVVCSHYASADNLNKSTRIECIVNHEFTWFWTGHCY